MANIGLKISGPKAGNIVVTYATSITDSDTAQQADFTAASTTATVSSLSTTGNIPIAIINDETSEENETFTLTLSAVTGAVFSGGQSSIVVQVTIIDDETIPTLSIDTSTINVAETAGYAEIGLTLSSSSTETVSISYSTAGVTATDGIDYTNQSSTTTEISSGTVGKIYIPITDDNVFEGIERFEVSITQITGAAYSTGVLNTPITVTITDNETQPTISISAYTCEESETIPTNMSINESIGNLIFNAKLSHPSKTPVTFNYSATVSTQSSINAASSADFYVTSSKEYTIYPGSVLY